jgi:hypothetical protein
MQAEKVNLESVDEFTFKYLPDKKYWVDPNGIPLLKTNGDRITGGAGEVFDAWDQQNLLLPMPESQTDYYNPKFSVKPFKQQAYEAFEKRESFPKTRELLKDIDILQRDIHGRIHNRETE